MKRQVPGQRQKIILFLHPLLLHQRNWEDGAQPAAKTRQEETRKGEEEMFGSSETGKGGEKLTLTIV